LIVAVHSLSLVVVKAKADIASVTEQINTRGWMGKIFITLLGLFAEMEKERIRERTADAMQNHQAKGRRCNREFLIA